VDLGERLQDLRDDVVALDGILRLLVHAKVGDGCDHVAEDFFFALQVEKLE